MRRDSFLRDRLRLTLWLSLVLVLTVVIQDLSQAAATTKALTLWQLFVDGIVGLCLIDCFVLLNYPLCDICPELLFLGFSL